MKIEGVPDGWELVRFGFPSATDWCLGHSGRPFRATRLSTEDIWPIIRRIEPICTWQHGVFADGWLTQDKSGSMWIFAAKPVTAHTVWALPSISVNAHAQWLNCSILFNSPKFRDDLPWTERIQQVGPTIEAQLKVMT